MGNEGNHPSMSLPKIFSRPSLFWAAGLIMYGAIFLYFFYTGASPAIQQDLWRYLPIVSQYYDNGFSLSILLVKHGEHLMLAYNAWFLLNSLLFGLSTRLELFIGLCFLGGFIILLYKPFVSSFEANVSLPQRRMAFLVLLGIALSFHQLHSFSYSLLAFAAFGEALFMMAFLIALDQALVNGRDDWSNWFAMSIFFFLLGAGFAGGGWVVYLFSSLVILFSWWATRPAQKKRAARIAIGLLAMAVPVYLVNLLVPGHSRSGSPGLSALYVIQHPGDAGLYLITLLANGVVDVNMLEKSGHFGFIYCIGIGLGLAYIYATYLFFKAKVWEKTFIPIYLMVFFWFVALVLLLFRFPVFGVDNAASPRYVTTLQIGILGIVWIFIVARKKSKLLATRVGILILSIGISMHYLFYLKSAANAAPYIQQYASNSIAVVKNEQFDTWSTTCPHQNVCKDGIVVLKDHSLNVFQAARK